MLLAKTGKNKKNSFEFKDMFYIFHLANMKLKRGGSETVRAVSGSYWPFLILVLVGHVENKISFSVTQESF